MSRETKPPEGLDAVVAAFGETIEVDARKLTTQLNAMLDERDALRAENATWAEKYAAALADNGRLRERHTAQAATIEGLLGWLESTIEPIRDDAGLEDFANHITAALAAARKGRDGPTTA